MHDNLKSYTVLGIYADNMQRYATTVEALNPEGAEDLARLKASEENDGLEVSLCIAGVLEGEIAPVDDEPLRSHQARS